jgi:hypothetical protein
MRVPAVDVTVKTRFAEATALLQVVSAGIERGALRLPGRLPCGRTFEIALLTASGELAIRGTAEAIRVDGDATLVRFLSASDDGSDRDAWVDLDDAVVTVAPTMAAPTTAAAGALRPRLRDRGDWVGAHGTPTPTSVPLPTPRVAAPPIPPLPPARSRAAAAPSELPALAPPARGPVGSMPLPRVDVAPLDVAPLDDRAPEIAPPDDRAARARRPRGAATADGERRARTAALGAGRDRATADDGDVAGADRLLPGAGAVRSAGPSAADDVAARLGRGAGPHVDPGGRSGGDAGGGRAGPRGSERRAGAADPGGARAARGVDRDRRGGAPRWR